MLSAGQWRQYNDQQEALVANSTEAGQNVINGTTRPELGATKATLSNPQGVCMRRRYPHDNPLAKPTTATLRNGAMKLTSKGYVPLKER